MNRQLHDLMMAQYATKKATGDGLVSWDGGVKCVVPSVKLMGAAVQDGTPTPDAPIMPVCNDGVYVGRSKNLLDKSKFAFEELRNETPIKCFSTNTMNKANIAKMLEAGKTYTASCVVECTAIPDSSFSPSSEKSSIGFLFVVSGKIIFCAYDSIKYLSPGESVRLVNTFVVPPELCDEANNPSLSLHTQTYVDADGNRDYGSMIVRDFQIEAGDTATPYTPYWDGGQATAPELWYVQAAPWNPGNNPAVYDEWSPQTGCGSRRIKRTVLYGTEAWGLNAQILNNSKKNAYQLIDAGFNFKESSQNGLCTHFTVKQSAGLFQKNVICTISNSGIVIMTDGVQTIDEFKAWLAEQAAAGTPVTLWTYGANPEPFYTEPQKLTQPNGHGQIIQVSGSVSDCPIEASYLTHS